MKIRLFGLLLLLSTSLAAETLQDAVQHGLISNPDLLFSTAKSLTDKQGIDVARGANYPTIDARAGFGRENSRNPTTSALEGAGKRRLTRSESDIELRQNLFAGGGILHEVKRNEYLYQAQRLKTQGVAEDLALEVIDLYLQVMLHEKLYGYAKQNLAEHKRLLNLIGERHEAGLAREAELDQSNSRLALAQSNVISARADLHEVRIKYAKIVGSWPRNLKWPKIPSSSDLPKNLAKSIEIGLENHPTVKSAYADIKEAKAQYLVAKAALYPRIDGVLSAANNRNLSGLEGANDSKLAMLRMNYNLFRGGSDAAAIRKAAYQVQEAFEVKNQALIDLKELMRLSWNTWIHAGRRLGPLRLHKNSSIKTRSAYQEQFKLGKRTLLDLLDSQNEYYNAQILYAREANAETFARYRILNGMGMLLSRLDLRLPSNVVNNDVFTSAQTHILLNEDMNEIPYPERFEGDLVLEQPVKDVETVPLTPEIVHKNTHKPMKVKCARWLVSAGYFKHAEKAHRLDSRLRSQGFSTFVYPHNQGFYVLLGPFEYRGHAANGMTRLKEVAKVKGLLITFKDESCLYPNRKIPVALEVQKDIHDSKTAYKKSRSHAVGRGKTSASAHAAQPGANVTASVKNSGDAMANGAKSVKNAKLAHKKGGQAASKQSNATAKS